VKQKRLNVIILTTPLNFVTNNIELSENTKHSVQSS